MSPSNPLVSTSEAGGVADVGDVEENGTTEETQESSLGDALEDEQVPERHHLNRTQHRGTSTRVEKEEHHAEFFSGYSGFPLSSKINISKFPFDQESGRRRTTLWMCYLQIIIYLLIYSLNFKNLITSSRHYDILVKTRSRMTTDDVGSRARTTKYWENLVLVVVLVSESKALY